MTFTDWKQKYYPTPADSEMTMVEAVEHSLRKWRGLTKEVLGEYGLKKGYDMLRDAESDTHTGFIVNGSTCALCKMFAEKEGTDCSDCPLTEVLGFTCDANSGAPYWQFVDKGNPLPMIAALEKALEFAKGVKP